LRKLGHIESFAHFTLLREVERERAREKVLRREELGEEEEG
jgi:heme exporter protein D